MNISYSLSPPFTFARSISPIVTAEHSITRMAVATEDEAKKQSGDNRTMGRKFTVPYGLYKANGFISAHLAAQTGFNEDDLNLFWDSLKNMFDHDHSAARGMMNARKLIVFKHSTALGNASAHSLFGLPRLYSTGINCQNPGYLGCLIEFCPEVEATISTTSEIP